MQMQHGKDDYAIGLGYKIDAVGEMEQ